MLLRQLTTLALPVVTITQVLTIQVLQLKLLVETITSETEVCKAKISTSHRRETGHTMMLQKIKSTIQFIYHLKLQVRWLLILLCLDHLLTRLELGQNHQHRECNCQIHLNLVKILLVNNSSHLQHMEDNHKECHLLNNLREECLKEFQHLDHHRVEFL